MESDQLELGVLFRNTFLSVGNMPRRNGASHQMPSADVLFLRNASALLLDIVSGLLNLE